MTHILDNPAWHALISGNRSLAHGNGPVRYFGDDVSPFAGLEENSIEQFNVLGQLVPGDRPLAIVSSTANAVPAPWTIIQQIAVWQMICTGTPSKLQLLTPIVQLGSADVPEMLKLTKLTNPGPFEQNTLRFGHYEGIYEGDRLIAMAGQRMNPLPYAEISAVCTHPDFLGRGLATQLLIRQIHRIKAVGEIPFLHVKSENLRAIDVYRKLGFEKRKEVVIYIIQKNSSAT